MHQEGAYVMLRYVTSRYVMVPVKTQSGPPGWRKWWSNYSDLRMLSYYFSLGGKDTYRMFMPSLCLVYLFYQSIVDLMDVLEQRKHEAILFTFKQVFVVPT